MFLRHAALDYSGHINVTRAELQSIISWRLPKLTRLAKRGLFLYYNYAMEFHVRSSLQSFNDCMLIPGLENIQAYNYQLMPLVEDMFDGKINMIANVIILAVIPLYIAIMTVFLKNGG